MRPSLPDLHLCLRIPSRIGRWSPVRTPQPGVVATREGSNAREPAAAPSSCAPPPYLSNQASAPLRVAVQVLPLLCVLVLIPNQPPPSLSRRCCPPLRTHPYPGAPLPSQSTTTPPRPPPLESGSTTAPPPRLLLGFVGLWEKTTCVHQSSLPGVIDRNVYMRRKSQSTPQLCLMLKRSDKSWKATRIGAKWSSGWSNKYKKNEKELKGNYKVIKEARKSGVGWNDTLGFLGQVFDNGGIKKMPCASPYDIV
nr:uncharacterized protein LOC117847565 [Setaria viridis]